MTRVLLDTNAYLRLAKRVRPFLGVPFNEVKRYELVVLPEVEKEVQRSARLKHKFPWFDDEPHPDERRRNSVRIAQKHRPAIRETADFMAEWVARNVGSLIVGGRSPPGDTDCYVLAVASEFGWIVSTDDQGMHLVAEAFDVDVLHCCDVLHKLWSAKVIDKEKVVEIYEALEANKDLPKHWQDEKTGLFRKIFKGR